MPLSVVSLQAISKTEMVVLVSNATFLLTTLCFSSIIATPSDFFCVRARFRLLDEPLNGYSIGVLAEKREDSVTGVLTVNDLCSFSDPSDPAKLVLSRW